MQTAVTQGPSHITATEEEEAIALAQIRGIQTEDDEDTAIKGAIHLLGSNKNYQ